MNCHDFKTHAYSAQLENYVSFIKLFMMQNTSIGTEIGSMDTKCNIECIFSMPRE
jgi:hypothetical protein